MNNTKRVKKRKDKSGPVDSKRRADSSARQQKPGPKPKLTMRKTEEALRRAAGVRSAAAQLLGVSRTTLWKFEKQHPKIAAVIEDIEESTLDLAEGRLMQKISSGNLTAIIFYLKTKGKDRGYVERREQTGKDGGPVQMELPFDLSGFSDEELTVLEDVLPPASAKTSQPASVLH